MDALPRSPRLSLRALPVLLVLGLLAACAGGKVRLATDPTDARVEIPHLNLALTTPCDLPSGLDEGDKIIVSKPGYFPFEGDLGDLVQIADGTYQVTLMPLPGAAKTQ